MGFFISAGAAVSIANRDMRPCFADSTRLRPLGESMLQEIEYLREISRHCRSGEPLPEDLARWLGLSLEEFLTHRALSIEDAMGIRSDRGGVPWWMEEAMRKRDHALRELAHHFAPHLGSTAQARHIYQLAIRYAASAWRFDRDATCLPKGYAGSHNEYLWHSFRSGAPMPIGERRLRDVLRTQNIRHGATSDKPPIPGKTGHCNVGSDTVPGGDRDHQSLSGGSFVK